MTLEHFDSIFAFVVIIAGVSLLVTTLTQMVAAALGLRGSHLHWGLKTLLANLDPGLTEHAERISAEVLRHPLISDSTFSGVKQQPDQPKQSSQPNDQAAQKNEGSQGGQSANLVWIKDAILGRFKLAAAIRPEELMRILPLLANPPAAKGAAALEDKEEWRIALAEALKRLDPQVNQVLQLATPELKKLFPDDPAKADQLMARMTGAVGDLSTHVEQWFGSVMDRVSQRFALHMRLWTVLFSVVVAFALQLDAFRLFQQVSADAELRARLVASAEALSRKGDEILTTTPTNAPAAVYIEAMKQLIASRDKQITNRPGGFSDLAGAQRWLTNQLADARVTNTEPWLREYETLVPGAKLSVAAHNLQALLDEQMQFHILPSGDAWSIPSWSKFLGIAASAALLSLGAPFWFNLLKTLSNLRPILANKEDKKARAEAKG